MKFVKMTNVSFQIMSDIHIETQNDVPNPLRYIKPVAPILVLAGDIGRLRNEKQITAFLVELCKKFQVVLYVIGNHEYGYDEKSNETHIKPIEEIMTRLTTLIKNLHFLNRSSVEIEGVCFAGCTLWTNTNKPVPKRFTCKGIGTLQYNNMHMLDLQFIKGIKEYCKEKKLKCVIITHFAPTNNVKCLQNDKDFYCSDLEYLFGPEIHTWVFGHLHVNYDMVVKGTHLVTNQKGKLHDKVMNFSLEKVVTV